MSQTQHRLFLPLESTVSPCSTRNVLGIWLLYLIPPLLYFLYLTYQQDCLSFYTHHHFARLDLPILEPGLLQGPACGSPFPCPSLCNPSTLVDSISIYGMFTLCPLLCWQDLPLSPRMSQVLPCKIQICSTHFPTQNASIYFLLPSGSSLSTHPRAGLNSPFKPPVRADRAWVPPSWAPCFCLTQAR